MGSKKFFERTIAEALVNHDTVLSSEEEIAEFLRKLPLGDSAELTIGFSREPFVVTRREDGWYSWWYKNLAGEKDSLETVMTKIVLAMKGSLIEPKGVLF